MSPADAEALPEAPPSEAASAEASAEEESTVVVTGGGLFEQSVSGGDAVTDGVAAADVGPSSNPALELNGYVRGDVFVGKVPGYQTLVTQAAYGELALQVGVKKGAFGSGYAEPRLRWGRQGDEQRLFVDLREAYVDAYFGDLDLRLGQQIIVWGRADAFNPTNNLTPSDLRIRSPREDDRRVGNVGLRAHYHLDPLKLEGVWMPLYVPVEYPPVAVPSYVTLADPDFPEPYLYNGTVAGRLHVELPAFEASVSYLHGHALLPGFALDDLTVGQNYSITVRRTAYRHDVVGFDFSTAIGDALGVRAEAAYRMPDESDEDKPEVLRRDLQYVLGLDRGFGPVSVIAQYLGRYVFDWELAETNGFGPDSLREFQFVTPEARQGVEANIAQRNQILFQQRAELQHLATVRLEWLGFHETVSLSTIGLMNFTTQEWLLFPRLEVRVTDDMTATIGGEVYHGDDDTLFGLIDAALSAGYAELRVAF